MYNQFQPYNSQMQQPMVQQPMMQQPQYPMQAMNSPQMVQQPMVQQQNRYQSYSPQMRRKFDTVQGEIAANVYPVDIGEEVILMDIDNPYIYKKRRGFDGKLETEKNVVVRYEEEAHDEGPDLSGYIRREEVDMMVQNAVQNAVEQRMSEMQPKKRTKAED